MQLFVRECAVPRAGALLVPLILSLALTGYRTSRQDQRSDATLEFGTSEHRAGDRRRLVVPTCQRLRRPRRPHAELRSRRPRGRSLYACFRGGAVVLPVARGAPDGPGSPSAAGRRQSLGNVAKRVRRLSGFAGARRLRGRLHRKRLGPRAVRARRPDEKPGRPPVQRL